MLTNVCYTLLCIGTINNIMIVRISFTIGYLIPTLLSGLLVERCLNWWFFQLGFLGAIHLIWGLVLFIKKRL